MEPGLVTDQQKPAQQRVGQKQDRERDRWIVLQSGYGMGDGSVDRRLFRALRRQRMTIHGHHTFLGPAP